MLNLENIDLIAISSDKPVDTIKSLHYSSKNIKFGSIKLLTHIDKSDITNVNSGDIEFIKINEIKSHKEYNNFCLKIKLYTTNDYILLVQNDSFVTNIEKWTNDFLEYDYIGAPWTKQQALEWGLKNRVGNGGFSLRSKKFLEYSSLFDDCQGTHEDGFLTNWTFEYSQKFGIKFPSPELALRFSIEKIEDIYLPENHFGFHGNHIYEKAEKYIRLKN
jgi:hypothetical protein